MTWIAFTGVVVAALALTTVPGYVLARVAGIRGLWAWSLAAPFGLTSIALSSLIAPLLGVPWNVLSYVVVAAVIGIALLILRGLTRMRSSDGPRSAWGDLWPPLLALAIAAVIGGVIVVRVIGDPENISQTFDNVFHLNAVRYVLDTGNASPLHVGSMTSPSGSLWFYPAVWHATSALIVQITGCSIPMAANALTLALTAFVWPAGIVLLTRVLFGRRLILTVAAGVIAVAVPAFPLFMIDYGVLYPYHMALCVLPVALAAVVRMLGIAHQRPDLRLRSIVVVLGCLPGMTLAHPGAFMAWLVLTAIAATVALLGALRAASPRARAALIGGYALFLVIGIAAARVLRPALEARGWPTTETVAQAVGEVLTLGTSGGSVLLVLTLAALAGLIACASRRRAVDWFVLTSYAVLGGLYVAASALPWPQIRDLLTASWYNNAPRLAALLPIIVVPFAALGVQAVADWLREVGARSRFDVFRQEPRGAVRIVGAATIVVVLAIVTQVGPMQRAVELANGSYALTPDSPLVNSDEMALLRELPAIVPADAVIAGSPWTGTSMAYAISDRQVLQPHILMESDADDAIIGEEAGEAEPGSAVCAAMARKNVEYILDFGSREVHGAEHPYPGYTDLIRSDAVERVSAVGQAALYRVIACTEATP